MLVGHLRPAVEHDIAARREGTLGAFGDRPVERFHIDIVGQQQAIEADPAADHVVYDLVRQRGGRFGIPRFEHDMRAHPQRMRGERAEGFNIYLELCVARGDERQFLMRVAGGAAMARHVLEAADHACAAHPVEHGAAQRRHLQGIAAQGAVADHIVGFGAAHIERGVIIDRDSHLGQLAPHRFGIRARGLDRRSGRDIPKPRERFARRIALPFGRFHPRDTPAFLVDRDDQMLASVDRAQIVRQPAQLRTIGAIARKQDVTRRVRLGEEGALVGR